MRSPQRPRNAADGWGDGSLDPLSTAA